MRNMGLFLGEQLALPENQLRIHIHTILLGRGVSLADMAYHRCMGYGSVGRLDIYPYTPGLSDALFNFGADERLLLTLTTLLK